MRIACDVDGVVANLHDEWYRRYNHDFDDDLTMDRVTTWDLHNFVKPECGKRIYEYLSMPDLYKDIKPIEGALEAIVALRELGHAVFFVTSCTYGMVDQKARWLERNGFVAQRDGGKSLPAELIVANTKQHIKADLLIDDAAHNVQDWVEHNRARAILFDYPHNRSMDKDVPSAFWTWCQRKRNWRDIMAEFRGIGLYAV